MKHILNIKHKIDGKKCNSNQFVIMINFDASAKISEKMYAKKVILGILQNVISKMVNV